LLNLGITEAAREALGRLGYDLDEILAQEEEPGLGNGGLGRLASCYMDSLASVEVPAVGYGIRYEFGIFDQVIRDGWQQEVTDKWLRNGNPWEIPRSEIAYGVKFGGHTEAWRDEKGRYRVRWTPETEVKGVAYDTPIVGYRVDTCNILRLWKAEAVESFDFAESYPIPCGAGWKMVFDAPQKVNIEAGDSLSVFLREIVTIVFISFVSLSSKFLPRGLKCRFVPPNRRESTLAGRARACSLAPEHLSGRFPCGR
jgi:Carbohydrate phosphorylase